MNENATIETYLEDSLYNSWIKDRQSLEDKWMSNWRAFRKKTDKKWKAGEGEGLRSNADINVTRQKVIAGHSIVLQQIVRNGRISFSIHADKGNTLLSNEEDDKEMFAKVQSLQTACDEALVRCDAEKSLAKNVLAMAVYGETYAKETTGAYTSTRKVPVLPEGITDISTIDPSIIMWIPETVESETFSWNYVPVWEIVRDISSDDLQAITGIFHVRRVSPYWLHNKIGVEGFNEKKIKEVLIGASNKQKNVSFSDNNTTTIPGLQDKHSQEKCIDYKEYHGRIPVALYDRYKRNNIDENNSAIDAILDDKDADYGDEVEVIAITADKKLIFMEINEGEIRPFERAVWEDPLDDIGGQGVADNVKDVHEVMTGAFRAFEDGTKASSALILAIKGGLLKDDDDIIKGIRNGFARIDVDEGPGHINDYVQQFQISNPGINISPLLNELKGALEEASLIPQISSGISTGNDEATAYEISQRVERATTYIGMVIRNIDEGLIEPMINRVIARIQEDDQIEGFNETFKVDGDGFAGYEARNIKIIAIYKLLQFALTNELLMKRIKLDDLLAEISSSLDLPFNSIWRSDADIQVEQQQIEIAAKAKAIQEQDIDTAEAEAKIEKDKTASIKNQAQANAIMANIENEQKKTRNDTVKTMADIETGIRKNIENE